MNCSQGNRPHGIFILGSDFANPTVRTIAAEKAKLEAQIAKLKPGAQMDALHRKIRQLNTAAHVNEWLSSPGLQPPKTL
jgi:hypothetical protein